MATVHLTLDGQWSVCEEFGCELKFHFPDATPEQMQMVPKRLLYPLLEVIDPPTEINDGFKVWRDEKWDVHRDYDLPAWIEPNGTRIWFQHNEDHREGDKPAFVGGDNSRAWYQRGKLHRENDLPAVIQGERWQWYQHDKQHRDGDKPAEVGLSLVSWYQHGQIHREGDKPAVIYANGGFNWAQHDRIVRVEVPKSHMKPKECDAYIRRQWVLLGEGPRDENGYLIR